MNQSSVSNILTTCFFALQKKVPQLYYHHEGMLSHWNSEKWRDSSFFWGGNLPFPGN